MTPLNESTYLNAAFLRMDAASEPLRVADPPSALIIFTSAPGLQGTLKVARVDLEGKELWAVDTGIDRFKLSQILPGDSSMAFIGSPVQVPGKVGVPIVVVVENSTGGSITRPLR